jgi:hypothetical protein
MNDLPEFVIRICIGMVGFLIGYLANGLFNFARDDEEFRKQIQEKHSED